MATETAHGPSLTPGATQVERLLAELNPPQREAVEHGEGPLLMLAGAGSGKTRALTHRIAYLVATGQARPSEILAITFTNKAATEMRERVEQLVGGVSRLMWVMTFHSACARILRSDAERLGYKRAFTIYDQSDSLRMVKRCMAEFDVDPKRFAPRAVQAQISGAKNLLLDAEAYRQAQGSYFEETVGDVYGLYAACFSDFGRSVIHAGCRRSRSFQVQIVSTTRMPAGRKSGGRRDATRFRRPHRWSRASETIASDL